MYCARTPFIVNLNKHTSTHLSCVLSTYSLDLELVYSAAYKSVRVRTYWSYLSTTIRVFAWNFQIFIFATIENFDFKLGNLSPFFYTKKVFILKSTQERQN